MRRHSRKMPVIEPPDELSGLERVVRELEPVLTVSALAKGLGLDELRS